MCSTYADTCIAYSEDEKKGGRKEKCECREKCLTDRIIVVLFTLSEAVIWKARSCERLKVSTVMPQ